MRSRAEKALLAKLLEEARIAQENLRKLCRRCRKVPPDGAAQARYCTPCKAERAKEARAKYWRSPAGRAALDRANAARRTPDQRAKRREYERAHRSKPEIRTRRLRNRKLVAMKRPELKREYGRRYKEKYPERVKEQQRKANEKRAAAKREHMHRYCTKYVGRGISPRCADCGAVIEWNGRGKPARRCDTCDPSAARAKEYKRKAQTSTRRQVA